MKVKQARLSRFDEAPAVCRAGWYQFAPGQTHTNRCVQSRLLFWSKSGRGSIVVNGVEYCPEPHDLFLLPWNRRITFNAAEKEPMFTAHVHVVPWYRPGAKWVPDVPHETFETIFDSPDRTDLDWFDTEGVIRFRIDADQSLSRLFDYTTRWYTSSDRSELEARALGRLVVRELFRLKAMPTVATSARPDELKRLMNYVEETFHEGPTVEKMAAVIGRSRSHVLKLFRRHSGTAAKSFIVERQLREARELLLSTTLPISEVGQRVGQPDPYNFYKLFRRHVGLSPREYRNQQGPFATLPKPSVHQSEPANLGPSSESVRG